MQKGVSTALRNLRKKCLASVDGNLTDAIIDRLQTYFSIAIRSSDRDFNKKKKAINASFFNFELPQVKGIISILTAPLDDQLVSNMTQTVLSMVLACLIM